MKYIFLIFTFVSFSAISQYGDYEHIISYHSDILVQENCELEVIETIKVYAGGQKISRGIFRDLPLSYEYRGGNVHVGFELLEVRRDGESEPYHTEWMSNGIRIYVGDKEVYLNPGYYTYQLHYRVDHVLGMFEDFDEIYWNINGTGWDFTIDTISARVIFPEGAKLVRYDGYTGLFGSTEKNFTTKVEGNSVYYKSDQALTSGENMTVAVAWEKGHLIYPTFAEQFWFWVRSYILWVIGILALLIGLIYNTFMWVKYGIDPKPGTIIPRFYPPEGFSPAECVYLKKGGRMNKTMFGAQLIGLAVKGYITIQVQNPESKNPSYHIALKENSDDREPLNSVETRFLNDLMGNKDTLVISNNKYNSKLKVALDNLTSGIDAQQDKKYFLRNTHLKLRQYILPAIALAAGIIAYLNFGGSIPVIILTTVVLVGKNVIFARLYEQPTAEGRRKMDEIAGFEMYMKYADKLRIDTMNKPTMDFTHYEKNLPYAIALGVADQWKNQFNVAMIEEGYTNHIPYMYGMSLIHLNSFTESLNTTISSASTPPSSSGSGSGGGGFSGGGGGGGGGGGW